MSNGEFNFDAGGYTDDSSGSYRIPRAPRIAGHALLLIMAVIVAYGCVKAAAGIGILIGKGIVVVSIGAAVIAALVATVQIIGEAFGADKDAPGV